MADIKIEYNGKYPNLCSGKLIVFINGSKWEFPDCLVSGGSVRRNKDWDIWATKGPWTIDKWPEGFPVKLKRLVEKEINWKIPQGCCGGCI